MTNQITIDTFDNAIYNCPVCLIQRKRVNVHCSGAEMEQREHPTILICACSDTEDFVCKCGNPCQG